jgi:hypothetical protein
MHMSFPLDASCLSPGFDHAAGQGTEASDLSVGSARRSLGISAK